MYIPRVERNAVIYMAHLTKRTFLYYHRHVLSGFISSQFIYKADRRISAKRKHCQD